MAMLLLAGWTDPAARAQGVPAGNNLVLVLEYSGSATGRVTGKLVIPCDPTYHEETARHTDSWFFNWTATLVLEPKAGGEFFGVGWGSLSGRAERTDHRAQEWWGTPRGGAACSNKESSLRTDSTCTLQLPPRGATYGATARLLDGALQVEARIPRALFHPQEWDCSWKTVRWTRGGGEETSQGKTSGPHTLVTHAWIERGDHTVTDTAKFTLPTRGRTTLTPSFDGPLPADYGDPAFWHCGVIDDGTDWKTGTCSARGSLKAHVLLDPCPGLAQRYRDFLAAVLTIQPPPAEAPEPWLMVWGQEAGAKLSAMLLAARQLIFQCGDDELIPDPREAMERVLEAYRDALLALGQRGKLTERGLAEVIGTERQLQLLGSAQDVQSFDLPIAAGTLEVSVHSPVALHAYDARGRHVGWNSSRNESEALIPGARYEGVPRGSQRILLPAGFYQIVVEELGEGTYVLDVLPNATGAGPGETFLSASRPGRSTSTHYFLESSGGNATLQGFLPRRAATPPASFFDTGFSAAAGPAPPGPAPAGEKGVPGASAAWALLAGAAAAFAAARRRGQGEV